MEWAGLVDLSYTKADVTLMCTNASMFLQQECTIPPLYSGYSAYLAPVAGGLIFGFLRNWCFGRLESVWMVLRKGGFEYLWFPYLGVHLVALFFSVIPTNIAMTTFVVLLMLVYGIGKTIRAGLLGRLRATSDNPV